MKQNELLNDPMLNVLKQHPVEEKSTSATKIDSVFYELQRTCYDGCTLNEIIAQNYRRRPCFKKIELLLSRLKQELNVHQNIVSNVNSQGTAWVIKDFIFIFTRIINAWIIMRGYIYDSSRELDGLRDEFDPEFISSFLEWQTATLKMIRPLISTIDMLNVHTQNKDASKKKKEKVMRSEPFEQKQYEEDFLEEFQKNLFTPQCVVNSEEIQLRNHHTNSYFRAGVLKPLMMPNGAPASPAPPPQSSPFSPYSITSPMTSESSYSASTFNDSDYLNTWFGNDDMNDKSPMVSAHTPHTPSERLYNRGRGTPMSARDSNDKNPFDFNVRPTRAKKGLVEQFNSMDFKNNDIDGMNIDIQTLLDNQEQVFKMYQGETDKIIYLLREIAKLPHVDDFALSINMMISSIKTGKYGKLADILGELKILIQHAKSLMKNAEDTKKAALKVFVSGLEGVMNRKAFD